MRREIDYRELAIRLEAGAEGGYRRRLEVPLGRAVVAPFLPPWEGGELDRVTAALGARDPGEHGAGRDLQAGRRTLPRDPREVGSALFSALLGGDFRSAYDQLRGEIGSDPGRGLRLRLILDPLQADLGPLVALPWELLYDPVEGRFLALGTRIPVVRFLTARRLAPIEPMEPPLRILLACASPTDLPPLELEREAGSIARAWESEGRVEVEVLRHTRACELRGRLREARPHVLHFLGHGGFDEHGGRGRLYCEDASGRAEALSSDRLARAVRDLTGIRLVVLAACDSARHGRNPGPEPYGGVAAQLVREGVPAVVAMQHPVSDRAAILWSTAFYRSLAASDPLEVAVGEGRLAVAGKGEEGAEWATPALFLGTEDGRLFELAGTGPAPRRGRLAEVARRLRHPTRRTWVAAGAVLVAATGLATLPFLLHPERWPAFLTNPAACPSPPGLDLHFSLIRAGRFEMGSDAGGDPDEHPAHPEAIAEDFCLGTYEVTRRQWGRILGEGEGMTGKEAWLPQDEVSFADAQEFLAALNRIDPAGGYRLPSEAEWEYAARAGTPGRWFFDDRTEDLARYANCGLGEDGGDGFEGPAPIGSLAPNPWGLHDVYGNVQEWVSGAYTPYPGASTPTAAEADLRVRRGGSYESAPENCSSPSRSGVRPDRHHHDSGLRLVRSVAGGRR